VVPPWAQTGYKIEEPFENWSTKTLHDPKLGTALPGFTETLGSRVVLVVSDCSECNSSKVSGFAATPFHGRLERIVLVASNISVTEAQSRFGRYRNIEFGIMTEEQKRRWNATFLPRVYLVNRHNTLAYIQPPSFSYAQAFWEIQKVLK
jgi:hypothetical protein